MQIFWGMESWERLEKVIKWSGLTVNAFAITIGLKRAENLYQIKKGRNSISRDLAETITRKYCNVSKSWLLTGEGDMFTGEDREEGKASAASGEIPFYGTLSGANGPGPVTFPKPLYRMVIPALSDCDFALSWMGDSMAPDVPSGAIVVVREMPPESIFPGEMYLVFTDRYTTIRRIKKLEHDEALLRLVPANLNAYDEAVVKKSDVRRLFLIKGVITLRMF